MNARKRRGELNFEVALAQLESIVKKLEEEEVPLEDSLKLFAEGQRLARALDEQLGEAENRVRLLLESADGELAETELNEQADDAFPPEAVAPRAPDNGDDSDDDPDGDRPADDEIPF